MGKEYTMNIELPVGARCVKTEVTSKGIRITYTFEECTDEQDSFVWVDISDLKESDFAGYETKSHCQKILQERILKAIRNNESYGFYAPRYEPSIDSTGNVQFVAGVMPEVGHSANWWYEKASKFCPERGSRMGTEDEYFLMVARFLKDGTITWQQASDDSSEIGNYRTTSDSIQKMEKTGTRKCGKFYGFVGNTCKYIKSTTGFAMVGGCFDNSGSNIPLVDMNTVYNQNYNCNFSVGWIILEK